MAALLLLGPRPYVAVKQVSAVQASTSLILRHGARDTPGSYNARARARPIRCVWVTASSSTVSCPPCRQGIVNAIPAHSANCPRSRQNPVHVPLESVSTFLWKPRPPSAGIISVAHELAEGTTSRRYRASPIKQSCRTSFNLPVSSGRSNLAR